MVMSPHPSQCGPPVSHHTSHNKHLTPNAPPAPPAPQGRSRSQAHHPVLHAREGSSRPLAQAHAQSAPKRSDPSTPRLRLRQRAIAHCLPSTGTRSNRARYPVLLAPSATSRRARPRRQSVSSQTIFASTTRRQSYIRATRQTAKAVTATAAPHAAKEAQGCSVVSATKGTTSSAQGQCTLI